MRPVPLTPGAPFDDTGRIRWLVDKVAALCNASFIDLITSNIKRDAIGLTITGSPVSTGIKGDLEVPYDCDITKVTLLADQAGSIVIDIWKDAYANFPPTVADTITAAAKPTISAATKAQDETLTGWTTALSAGDILRFNVDSAATVTRVAVILTVQRS